MQSDPPSLFAMTAVHRLDATDDDAIVATLAAAFRDYPVMRHVLGVDADTQALHTLIGLFVANRTARSHPVWGVRDERGELVAVATTTPCVAGDMPPSLIARREATWQALGDDARRRYDAFAASTDNHGFTAPHLHLNMLGVLPGKQGSGLGGLLLRTVYAHAAQDGECAAVSLTTELAANLPFYARHGFVVLGESQVGESLRTWSLFRTIERVDRA